jgi:hypothetical protein
MILLLIPFTIIFTLSLTIIIRIMVIRKIYRSFWIYKIKWTSFIISLLFKFTTGIYIHKIDLLDKFLYLLDMFLTFYSFIALYFIMEFKYFLFITPTGVYSLVATFTIFTGLIFLALYHFKFEFIPKFTIKYAYYA